MREPTTEHRELIATLGPATRTEAAWADLLEAGATQFRLNTSHMDVPELDRWLTKIAVFLRDSEGTRAGAGRSSTTVPVVLDLQGSKWRVGDIPERELVEGDRVIFVPESRPDSTGQIVIPVPHRDFFAAADYSDGAVLLNDARVLVQLGRGVRVSSGVSGIVRRGGTVASRKGITVPSSPFRAEQLSEKDASIIELSSSFPFARIAISYVRDDIEMQRYRAAVPAKRRLIAKIERTTAIESIDRIARAADEMWLCRGDLGAELGLVAMAREIRDLEHRIHGGTRRGFAVPVLLAGQVLEHMVEHPEPTRAEVCQLYDAFSAGYSGIVLSDETAIGKYAVSAVQTAALFR